MDFFFLPSVWEKKKKNNQKSWAVIEYMSVCLLLPDVRWLPSTTLMVYPHEFLLTFTNGGGRLIFSGYSSDLVLIYMFEPHSDSVWLYLLRHTRGIQVLCFSPFLRHRACNATVALPRAVLYTTSFSSSFGSNTWTTQAGLRCLRCFAK